MMKRIFTFILLFPLLALAEQADCKIYFSPKDQLADRLIELIQNEEKSIKVAIYSMTHLGIAKALVEAKARGVAIEVLIDPTSVKNKSSVHRLVEAKVPLFVWDLGMRMTGGKRRGLMHDKFCIFGDHTVWTGSFNFTQDAHLKHQENAVAMGSREIAQKYLTQFVQMKLYESRPYHEFLALYPKKKGTKKIK
ncbi:MAG: DUF1669 domain-containing protein [Verrucomicrobia bacterium]|nr:DUF1669 domain-containing protein [Verrucomicrobiota bacterium]